MDTVKKEWTAFKTRLAFDRFRRTTRIRTTGMDDTHVYVQMDMTIPKAELSLDEAEAQSDADEFGNAGIALTLRTKVRQYLAARHAVFRNSTPWFAESDPRPIWRMAKALKIGGKSFDPPRPTTFDDVMNGNSRSVAIVSNDPAARLALVMRVASKLGRAAVVVDLDFDFDAVECPAPLDFALLPGSASQCVVYINGLTRTVTSESRSFTYASAVAALAHVKRTLDFAPENRVVILGYNDLNDIPLEIVNHPSVTTLLADDVGCTDFGTGYVDSLQDDNAGPR